MNKEQKTIRLRITKTDSKAISYIVRSRNGNVSYMSGGRASLALSNLVGTDAAELTFGLEDARDEHEGARMVRDVLQKQFKNNALDCPIVEII